jgi:sugar/nucleoside kinase (ribokinase family)
VTIAVIGNLSLDRVAGSPSRPGGPVLYAARALARVGDGAHIGAACADVDRSLFAPALEDLRLPVTWYTSSATAAYSFEYDGDRRLMRQDAVGDPWGVEQALEAVADAEWVHVGALVRTDFPAGTLAALARGGRTVLVDGQGLLRTPELGPLRLDRDAADALRYISILKLDEEEAQALAGGAEPELLRSLGVPEVLLTLGSRGSVVITDRAVDRLPAAPVGETVDPTGAGDAFAAVYLRARAEGDDPVTAATRATDLVAELLRARA